MDKTVGKSASGASSSSGANRPWMVRKRGGTEVLHCPDLATLRTWMLERRLTRDDEISRGGQSFRRMGSIIEFESLFHSVDVERAQARRATGQHAATPASGAGAATGRGPARTGTPQGLPALGASAPAAGARPAEASIGPMRVTPLGITPAPGGMSPIRATPSGQPAPRRPQPAMPGLAGSVQAAQRSTPPSTPPATTPTSDPNKGRLKPPARSPSGVVPQAVPAAVADSLAGPLSGSPSGRPPSGPGPAALKERPATPPVDIGDRDEEEQPTQRMEKLDLPKPGPVPAAAPQDSGSQTVVFRRGDSASSEADADADAEPLDVSEPTRRLPPAAPVPIPAATGDRTVRLPPAPTPAPQAASADPIAEAILKNDPVPRHLKDPTDSSRIVRGPAQRSLDMTERIEKKPGPSLVTISLGVAGALGLVFYLSSRGGPEPTGPQTEKKPETPITEPENPVTRPETKATEPTTATTPSETKPTTPPGTETKPTTPPGAETKPTEPATAAKPTTETKSTTPATSPASPPTATAVPAEPAKTPGAETKPATPPTASNPPATAAKPTTPAAPTPSPGKEPAKAATPGSEPAKTPGTEAKPTTPPTASSPPATAAKPNPPATANPPATVAAKPATPTPPSTSTPSTSTRPKKIVVTEIPKTFDGQMELAQRLVEAEQFDDAQRLFETMLPTAGHVAAIHVGLGKCALETGRLDAAIGHYQDALKRAENYGPAVFGLAKTYRAKGDKAQAITYYKRYLADHPTGAVADVARAAIAKLEGQPPPAPAPDKTPLIVQ